MRVKLKFMSTVCPNKFFDFLKIWTSNFPVTRFDILQNLKA